MKVTVRFDASAERSPVVVVLPGRDKLTPLVARLARAIEAPGANVVVSDGDVSYHVTDSDTRLVKSE